MSNAYLSSSSYGCCLPKEWGPEQARWSLRQVLGSCPPDEQSPCLTHCSIAATMSVCQMHAASLPQARRYTSQPCPGFPSTSPHTPCHIAPFLTHTWTVHTLVPSLHMQVPNPGTHCPFCMWPTPPRDASSLAMRPSPGLNQPLSLGHFVFTG